MKNTVSKAMVALAIIFSVAQAATADDTKKSRVAIEFVWDSVSEAEATNLVANALHGCGWPCNVEVKVSAAGLNMGGGGNVGTAGEIDAGIEADHDDFVAD